jgi:hypothetical protein
MKSVFVIFLLFIGLCHHAFAQLVPYATQINEATLAIPDELRSSSTVMGFNDKNELIIIKSGNNGMICIADDPTKKDFQASCYHIDLEPFMARGRELQKQGKNQNQIFEIREKEAKEGKLKMPEKPSTLHIMYGETAEKANYRYVVYIPWATAESTGLPLKPMVPGGPWIMDPGTHRAHIMITPPAQN